MAREQLKDIKRELLMIIENELAEWELPRKIVVLTEADREQFLIERSAKAHELTDQARECMRFWKAHFEKYGTRGFCDR